MKAMDIVEKILGPGKDDGYAWPVHPLVEYWKWRSKIFYRKGKNVGSRKCLIGCKGTSVWIFVGAPPTEDHRLDLKDPGSIQKIKTIMRVK